jgi:dipeptidyl aminopeptidase/acylaminoacyl peptidase
MHSSRSCQALAWLLPALVLASCAKKEAPPKEESRELAAGEKLRFEELTIRQIMQGPGVVGTPPSNPRFSADGQVVYFEWNDPAPLDSMNASAPEDAYQHYLDLEKKAGTYRLDVATKRMEKLAKAVADTTAPGEFAWDRERKHRAEIRGGDLFLVDLEPARTRRITQTLAAERSVQMSPDGKTVYFLRDNDVYAIAWSGGPLRQLTNLQLADDPDDAPKPTPQRKFLIDQQKELFVEFKDRDDDKDKDKARPRAVYLGAGLTIQSVAVSPSGRYAAVGINKPASGARAPLIPIVPTESGYLETEEARSYVGDAQDVASVAFVDLTADSLIQIDAGEHLSVNAMSWSPADDIVLLRGLTDDSQDRLFMTASPVERLPSGHVSARVVDRWHDPAWVDGPDFDNTGAWMPDGKSIYFIAEPAGWGHLYTATRSGRRTQLTHGEFEVYGAWLDEDGKRWLIVSNEGRPGARRLWTMDLDGSHRTLVTPEAATYEFTFSPDMRTAAVLGSKTTSPTELYLFNAASGALDGPLTVSTTKVFRSFPWLEPETVWFTASDGVSVPAHLFTPERYGGTPNGAGIIFIHGAGYLQNVIDGWSYYYREFMFHHFLAARGYTVLNVDYRGSAGYGRDCRTAIYKHMGGRDLDDIIDGAHYLEKEHGVGVKQVGVYGGSYGGFLTLMAMFKYPKDITSGAALRSVTDWAHYNHGYTVRILGTPADDPEAYRRSSPIYFAEGLEGNLLILHGLRDDNVLAEDDIRLAQRLIELGKENWELALHPVERHGYRRAASWTDQMTRAYKLFARTLPAGAGSGD